MILEMTETELTPEIAPTPGLDQTATTVQIRKWITTDMDSIGTLLSDRNETVRGALPADLVALADKHVAKGRSWTRWLIIGVCVRFTLRCIQASLAPTDRLRPSSVTCLPNVPNFASTEPKPKRAPR